MSFVVAAYVWGLACVTLALRFPASARVEADEDFAIELGEALEEATSDPERLTLANDALRDVEQRLEMHRATPKLAGWMAVAGVALILVVGVLARPETLLAAGLGGIVLGVLGALVARRRGDAEVERAKERADRTVASLVGDLYDAEIAVPMRRQPRFRRRSRG